MIWAPPVEESVSVDPPWIVTINGLAVPPAFTTSAALLPAIVAAPKKVRFGVLTVRAAPLATVSVFPAPIVIVPPTFCELNETVPLAPGLNV